jgi:hypothetical protein
VNILRAIKDENLFGPFFGNDLSTWMPWLVCLRAIYGLPITSKYGRRMLKQCTGRDARKLPKDGFNQALILTGRRSGKSRIASVIGAYSATVANLHQKLAPGENGLVAVVTPTKRQGAIVRNYVRSAFDVPILRQEIMKERSLDAFQLRSGTRLEILASDYRSVRGFTLLGVVVDEACFLGLSETSRISTDTQLIRALEPALATTDGKLIAISSPYSRSGWAYETYQRHYGRDSSQDILVWQAPSRVMNSTLRQSVVDKAKREDLAAALSEYEAQWRDDVSAFCPLELVEQCVVRHRVENIPEPRTKYHAFVDLSGGRNDASCLCIAHKDGNVAVLDVLKDYPAPHNPHLVIGEMVRTLERWKIRRVTGDAYSAEFAAAAFQEKGIAYRKCDKNKSALYADLLPLLSSGRVELLDHQRMIKQLCQLERRTRAGGKDVIDHPQGQHDDLINAAAGALVASNSKLLVVGAGGF